MQSAGTCYETCRLRPGADAVAVRAVVVGQPQPLATHLQPHLQNIGDMSARARLHACTAAERSRVCEMRMHIDRHHFGRDPGVQCHFICSKEHISLQAKSSPIVHTSMHKRHLA